MSGSSDDASRRLSARLSEPRITSLQEKVDSAKSNAYFDLETPSFPRVGAENPHTIDFFLQNMPSQSDVASHYRLFFASWAFESRSSFVLPLQKAAHAITRRLTPTAWAHMRHACLKIHDGLKSKSLRRACCLPNASRVRLGIRLPWAFSTGRAMPSKAACPCI